MGKRRWSCSFLSVNTLIHRVGALLAVSTLLVLGTATPVMAKCDFDTMCEKGENAKNCSDCRVPKPPDDPPANVLKANLTGGVFVFAGPLPVVLNAKQTEATSSADVVMNRPDSDYGFQTEWDCVFLGAERVGNCPPPPLPPSWDGCKLLGYLDEANHLVGPGDLDPDEWRIFFGEADGGGLRLNFRRSFQENDPSIMGDEVEISLQMIGVTPDYSLPGQTIPPPPGEISQFSLEDFILAGDNTVSGTRPRRTCQPGPGSGGHLDRFTLFTVHTLTICGADDGEENNSDDWKANCT